MKTAQELKVELAEAKARVAKLEAQLREADYPVGTILRRSGIGFRAIAYKVDGIDSDYASDRRKASADPVWAVMFEDFSGGAHKSLAVVEREYGGTWEEVFRP